MRASRHLFASGTLRFLLLAGLVAFAAAPRAQELDCAVTVNTAALGGTQYAFLSELQPEIERYLNNRAWTEDTFADRERIDCQVQVTFTQAEGLSRFQARLVVGANRPIYGTSQQTNVFIVQDNNWEFDYNRGQGLIYNPNVFNAFTSVLDFYALLILGYDYDTFDELGGQRYFERARDIAELARGSSARYWFEVGDERTRGALIQQIMDPRFEPLRRAYFAYHFEVLDRFTADPEAAWARTLEILTALNTLYAEFNARRYATDVFFGAKYQELPLLLADAPERLDAYELLIEMDQTHQTTYDALVSGGGR